MIQPGDILLFRIDPHASFVDRMIGWGEAKIGETAPQGREYYHIAFVSNDTTKMYSAQPPKIDLYPIPQPLPSYIELMRVKGGLDHVQLINIFKYAESRRGRLYDFAGVLTFGFLEFGGLEFCSQYTEDSFAQGRIMLAPDIRFTTPDDIASSDQLLYAI